jgi:hypothetical protein
MKKEEPKFISLAEAAKITNYSQDYISLLCRQGKLKAEKLGRNWVTTKDWVYSYIDNTEGRGESIVPVKIKETARKEKKDKNEKSGKDEKERGKKHKPLFGSMIFEFSIFCLISLFLLANIIAFYKGVKAIENDYNSVQDHIHSYDISLARESAMKSAEADAAAAAASAKQEASASCAAGAGMNELLSFDKETDTATIAKIKQQVEAIITEKADIEVYKKFAIVTYKNKTKDKFLYMRTTDNS